MDYSRALALFLVVLSFIIAVYEYPSMPERMASHWNYKGEIDGYMPKLWGLFLMPVLSLVLLVFFFLIPGIDPLKQNIKEFIGYYDGFILAFTAFLFYLFVLTILLNQGYGFNMTQSLSPAFGMLFYYLGILMKNAKRNWFVGIRTPWTMSSDVVWEKTHTLGGKLFKLSGLIALVGVFSADYGLFFVIVPILVFSAYLVVYSYLEYQKENSIKH